MMSTSAHEVTSSPMIKRLRHDDDEDRLSELPGCVLIHILSFLHTKHVVQTCVLSTQWKHLWKHIPTLILHYTHFSTLKSFDKFVSRILSLRDASTTLYAFNLKRNGSIESRLLKRIVNYVLSHNVKLHYLGIDVKCDICDILPCISSSQTLTSLNLSVAPKGRYNNGKTLFPKSLDLPTLTTLHLEYFSFLASGDGPINPFSGFKSLTSLTLRNCNGWQPQVLSISNATLANLTMHNDDSILVSELQLSAPSLSTFTFTGTPIYQLCGTGSTGLSSVKQVNIDANVLPSHHSCSLALLLWLLDLANVESLIVSASTLQALNYVSYLWIELKISSLCKLKSLKVLMKSSLSMPNAKHMDFFLQNSPSAQVIIDHGLELKS